MSNGRLKRKRQYHHQPAPIDIRVKVWGCLRFLAEKAVHGIASFTAYVIMLLSYLTYLNPLPAIVSASKVLFSKQRPRRLLTYQYNRSVTYKPSVLERIRNAFKSDRALKRELLLWLRDTLPVVTQVNDFSRSWSNGVALCALVDRIVPRTCPRYDLLRPDNRVNNCRLGMTLVRKTLGIEEPLEPEEMADPRPETESKLVRYIQSIRYASMVPPESPVSKSGPWTTDGSWPKKYSVGELPDKEKKHLMEADKIDCTASGSGLLIATVGRRAKFNVYTPRFITKSLFIHIKGPQGESVRRKIINHLPGGRPHRDDPESSNLSNESGLDEGTAPSSSSSGPVGFIPCEYQCVREGHYEVSYVPQSSGAYRIAVTWGGDHVGSSPFTAQASIPDPISALPESDSTNLDSASDQLTENHEPDKDPINIQEKPSEDIEHDPVQDIKSSAYPETDTKARARRRISFCRQSHVGSTLRESYESSGTFSPYDSRCSSILMSSTERSMDSDVFFPYGAARAKSFLNASRRGFNSSSSSRSSMISHRSGSILSSGGDRPGSVRTRRKIIKRTIRGADGKEEIQYPSSADMSTGMSPYSGFSMSGMSSSSLTSPQGQSSISNSLSISDERTTSGMSPIPSNAPSPAVLAPVPNIFNADRSELSIFADMTSQHVISEAMYDLSKRFVLQSIDSSKEAEVFESPSIDLTRNLNESQRQINFSERKISLAKIPLDGNQDSQSTSNATNLRNKQVLQVAQPIGDGINKQMESQVTLEFEPELGADASNSKETSSTSASKEYLEKDHTEEESGYSTLEDTLKGVTTGILSTFFHGNMEAASKGFASCEQDSTFEIHRQGFRPVNPHLDNGIASNADSATCREYLRAPKPQRRHFRSVGQTNNLRRIDQQTQCTADSIKRETGWIGRRSAFIKQKREEHELSQNRTTQDDSNKTNTTVADIEVSRKSRDQEQIIFDREKFEIVTPPVDRSTSNIPRTVRQSSSTNFRARVRSVGRQSTFDSGYSDENGHLLNLSTRDRPVRHASESSIPTGTSRRTVNASDISHFQVRQKPLFDDNERGDVFSKEPRKESDSIAAHNITFLDRSAMNDGMLEDDELFVMSNRRPSFTAINFDLSHLHHVLDSQDTEPSPDRSHSPPTGLNIAHHVEKDGQDMIHSRNAELDVASGVKRIEVADEPSHDLTQETSYASSTHGPSSATWNDKEVPVSKLLTSLENDPNFTIREFLRKFMPSLDEEFMTMSMRQAEMMSKESVQIRPPPCSVEPEMSSSWSDMKLSILSGVGAESSSKKESRRQTPRIGTPLSSGAHSSTESHLSTARPMCCRATGIGIREGLVGVKNNFQVETSNAGEGSLGVVIRGPRPHTVCETSVTYTGDDLYEVVYEVNLAGFYVVSVKWGDNHIPESPFIVQISF